MIGSRDNMQQYIYSVVVGLLCVEQSENVAGSNLTLCFDFFQRVDIFLSSCEPFQHGAMQYSMLYATSNTLNLISL